MNVYISSVMICTWHFFKIYIGGISLEELYGMYSKVDEHKSKPII